MCTVTALDGKWIFQDYIYQNVETWTDVVYTKTFRAGNPIRRE